MNVNIQVIPRQQMRPEVDGADWWFDEHGDLQVRVCPMSDWRYEIALAFHEAFEGALCKNNGVTVAEVDRFDQEFDLTHPNEPDLNAGDDPKAPYRKEHNYSTIVDRLFIGACGLDFGEYDKELGETYPGPSKRK
jgi:hypothetical protein